MHDPLAVGAFNPSLVKTQRAFVDVETIGELTRGMTVAEFRRLEGRRVNAQIAVEVDAERFIGGYVDAIVRLAKG